MGSRSSFARSASVRDQMFRWRQDWCWRGLSLLAGSLLLTGCPAQEESPLCGDGALSLGEECDDGNLEDADGCDASCRVESGFACSVDEGCYTVCGDGVLSAAEECDDGVNDGTGCRPDCTRVGSCGDGLVGAGEQCDDGNAFDGDGCARDCVVEAGYICNAGACSPICGDGIVTVGEQCDDGDNNGDGYGQCRPDCVLGPFCGDGVVTAPEQCDDGNNDGSLGCAPGCSTN